MTAYSFPIRVLHWLMAILILSLIGIGFYMTSLEGDEKWWFYGIHKSFGVLVLMLLILRVAFRLRGPTPPLPQTIRPLERWAAHTAHFLLYVLMLAVPVSGFIMSDAGGHPIGFFGWTLPDMIPTNKVLGGIAHEIHEVAPYIMLAIVLAHAAGALKHQWFDAPENRVLKRMWRG